MSLDAISDLQKAFRERYLDTHEKYLGSISTLILHDYVNDANKRDFWIPFKICRIIKVNKAYFKNIKRLKLGNEEKSIRNIQNSWFNECALRYPTKLPGYEESLLEKERMKFAPWKIIQFYYTIYASMSAIVRCVNSTPNLGHKRMINIFTNDVLSHPKLRGSFFVQPFCFYLTRGRVVPSFNKMIQWDYGLERHCPKLKECLRKTFNNHKLEKGIKRISLFHYFKDLREWANYEDAYIFMNLYGESVRLNLNWYLVNITHTFNTLAEIFLISYYGFDFLNEKFRTFKERVKTNLEFDPEFISMRFDEYKELPNLV